VVSLPGAAFGTHLHTCYANTDLPTTSLLQAPVPEENADGDFTAEELKLEKEVEQALSEVEAADAAVMALRMQLENATEDVVTAKKDLSQLFGYLELSQPFCSRF